MCDELLGGRGDLRIYRRRVRLLEMLGEVLLASSHRRRDEAQMLRPEIADFLHHRLVIPAVHLISNDACHQPSSAFAAMAVDEDRPVARLVYDLQELGGLLIRRSM